MTDTNDDDREWSDYEQGAIDALTEVAWKHGDRALTDMRGEATAFDNWRELIAAAIRQREREFDDAVDDTEGDS